MEGGMDMKGISFRVCIGRFGNLFAGMEMEGRAWW